MRDKINILGQFSSRKSLKNFSDKILLDNNMNHLLKKKKIKNVHNRRITIKKL